MLMFPLSVKLSTGVQSVYVPKRRLEDRTFHISKVGRLRDRCSPALLPQSLMFCNRKCTCISKGTLYMCIVFMDTTPVVVLLVYVNDCCYYRNWLYTTGTGAALRKNRSMRVPVYSI